LQETCRDRAHRAPQYLDLQRPLYQRREAIVAGASAPSADEIARGEAVSRDDDSDYEPAVAAESEDAAVGVPEFWLTALRNHVELAEIITDKDAEVLKHLTDVRLSYLPSEPAPGYKLTFVFAPNAWFENTELEKSYVYQTEVGYAGDFIYERALGTEIRWKSEEKDLTKVVEVKKQRNKSACSRSALCSPHVLISLADTNRTRLVKKTRQADSFFNFFSPPVPPKDDDEDGLDEDELAELELKLEVDYQIGEDFKEKLIPRAVDYFTGKALDYETDEDEFEDFDEDDDEDELDSEDDVRRARATPLADID
jgi:nucleosome assembly protein 1-like 1